MTIKKMLWIWTLWFRFAYQGTFKVSKQPDWTFSTVVCSNELKVPVSWIVVLFEYLLYATKNFYLLSLVEQCTAIIITRGVYFCYLEALLLGFSHAWFTFTFVQFGVYVVFMHVTLCSLLDVWSANLSEYLFCACISVYLCPLLVCLFLSLLLSCVCV